MPFQSHPSSSVGISTSASAPTSTDPATAMLQQKLRLETRLNHYHKIIPLKAYHPLLRLDTLPYIIIYFILIVLDRVDYDYDYSHSITSMTLETKRTITILGSLILMNIQKWNHIIIFPLVLLSQIALFLLTRWNQEIETVVGYKKDCTFRDCEKWTHCLVIPPGAVSLEKKKKKKKEKNRNNSSISIGNVGRKEIVPVMIQPSYLSKSNIENENNMIWVATILYEEIKFRSCIQKDAKRNKMVLMEAGKDVEMDSIWEIDDNSSTNKNAPKAITIDRDLNNDDDDDEDTTKRTSNSSIFHQLHYPIDFPLSFYTRWNGHSSITSVRQTLQTYSNNRLHINLPPFIDLLTQQLLAPFFLFQLFCVLLWCLDEYWYYALFTLFTLILFECTMAWTRLKNLSRLRDTLRPPFSVWTYRCQKWKLRTTNDLIVGDVISLTSHCSSTSQQRLDHENGTHIPADLLLLKGGAVMNEAMLTGESVPQMKESIDVVASASSILADDDGEIENRLDIEDSTYKRAILFGGTVLVNHSVVEESSFESGDGQDDNTKTVSSSSSNIPSPPDDGCVALVLRTGFDTQQGSLLRTMVHTSTKAQSDGVNTTDTLLFIVILLICAVFSSIVVLKHGWNDPTRNRFKLVLHVIIIITSVVPPELPMELSLAVTSSLSDLIKRCSVYCTEPFRIPLAGMVDTCAFDKTGTLTSDEMLLRGVRVPTVDKDNKPSISESVFLPQSESNGLNSDSCNVPDDVLRVMVGCQSLANMSNYNSNSVRAADNLIGDPLEKAVLDGCGWTLVSNTIVAPPQALLSSPQNLGMINIEHRFAFTSKLKRMTVIATDLSSKRIWALSKGAPETLKMFLDPSTIPDSYDSVSRYHMSLGQRVLAMGYKQLSKKVKMSSYKKHGRQALETNLIFAGFLVLDCPLKPDSRRVIKELRSSGHEVVMITGDAVLTAAEVARQVGIIDKKGKSETYELREIKANESIESHSSPKFAFVPICKIDEREINTENCIAYSIANLKVVKEMLSASNISAICVTGEVLTKIAMETVRQKVLKDGGREDIFIDAKTVLLHHDAQATLQKLVPLISVFARHAPRQKEAVIAAFNRAGRYTLMCGDGTNDVGALKMSHVGISIISVPGLEAKQREAISGLENCKKDKKKKKKSSKKTWEDHMRALQEADEELNNVALGDASVASPFTSRATSIKCTKDVLQRGRCTLVTMLQIYKILGVNCLVNALVLSSLHLEGAKQGDSQLTVVGLIVAGLFFFVTKGEPLDKLSKRRPPSSVLSVQVLVSIVVQFFIHFIAIMTVTFASKLFLDPKYDPSLVPDGAFNPNTLNTATFLITVTATVNTFVVNYRGRPFMQDLHENKLMLKSLQACYIVLFACAFEIFPPLNDLLQLSPLPSGLPKEDDVESNSMMPSMCIEYMKLLIDSIGIKTALCLVMCLDSVTVYFAEKSLIRIFEG